MEFGFSEEQGMLRELVSGFLRDRYDPETRRAVVLGDAGWRPEIWAEMAELGLLGALLPERLGGLGGGPIEAMILMEEAGRALVVEPLLETVVIGSALLEHADPARAESIAGQLAAGEARIALAYAEPESRYNLANVATVARQTDSGFELSGHKAVVIGGPTATHIALVARTSGERMDREGISLFLIDKVSEGLTTRDYQTVDGRLASELYFERMRVPADTLVGELGGGLTLLETILDRAMAALCAEGCGVLRALVDGTVAYTKERKQFGRALADFQVLQHRMVNMMLQSENAQSITWMASSALAEGDPEAARAVAAAKVYVGEACADVGKSAVQLHGGMGTTDELAISHFFKRAMMIESQFGSSDHHLDRFSAFETPTQE